MASKDSLFVVQAALGWVWEEAWGIRVLGGPPAEGGPAASGAATFHKVSSAPTVTSLMQRNRPRRECPWKAAFGLQDHVQISVAWFRGSALC